MKLVTGGNGFIGQAILETYGDETVSLTRRAVTEPQGRPGHKQVVFDLTRTDQVQDLIKRLKPLNITEVIHAAAITPWSAHPDFSLDVAMTSTITEVCNSLQVPRLTFLSGWIVYNMHGNGPFDESTPLGPTAPYGESKLASERYFTDNLTRTNIVNLRLASLYGPGQTSPGLIPNFVTNALAGEPLIIGAAETKRDYLYISDLMASLKKLSEVQLGEHTAINLGSGQAVTVEEVAHTIQTVCKEQGLKPVRMAYQAEMKEAVPLTNELDITKAKSLGILGTTTSLHEGLAAYITWRNP